MSASRSNQKEHSSLKPLTKKGQPEDERQFEFKNKKTFVEKSSTSHDVEDFVFKKNEKPITVDTSKQTFGEIAQNGLTAENVVSKAATPIEKFSETSNSPIEKKNQSRRKSVGVLDKWLLRRGHGLTYALLFAFTFVLYFRPYELVPGLAGLSSIALYLAAATLLVFVPSQLAAESSLTARPAEVNLVLLLAFFGLATIPIARNPAMAWEAFYDPFLKVVLMFVVMINVVRTEARLKSLIWLALAVGVWLAVEGIGNYASGKLTVEDYRAMADVKGMFGNPNAQAMHFVSVTPIAVALCFAARSFLFKTIYIALAVLFIAGNIITFSRGGFLGLIVVGLVLAWKIGRDARLKVMLVSAFAAIVFTLLAPGNYRLRVLSIFIPVLDPVGSSSQRSDLLWTSIIVTLRNPWGIGMMNFTLANGRSLVTHNSYTQVSAEMGILALACYLLLIVTPFRRLTWIEAELNKQNQRTWIYYLSIGLQASLAGYAVSSFFDSAAYQWFLYYLVAYAVCLRRVHQIAQERDEATQERRDAELSSSLSNVPASLRHSLSAS